MSASGNGREFRVYRSRAFTVLAAIAFATSLIATAGWLRWGSPWLLLPIAPCAFLVWQLRRMDPAGLCLSHVDRLANDAWALRGREGVRAGDALIACRVHCEGRLHRLLWLRVEGLRGEFSVPYLLFDDALAARDWRLLRRALRIQGE